MWTHCKIQNKTKDLQEIFNFNFWTFLSFNFLSLLNHSETVGWSLSVDKAVKPIKIHVKVQNLCFP